MSQSSQSRKATFFDKTFKLRIMKHHLNFQPKIKILICSMYIFVSQCEASGGTPSGSLRLASTALVASKIRCFEATCQVSISQYIVSYRCLSMYLCTNYVMGALKNIHIHLRLLAASCSTFLNLFFLIHVSRKTSLKIKGQH